MKTKLMSVCLMLPLLAAGSAHAEIVKGVMGIKGAEMS